MAHNTRKSIRARLISSEDSRVCTICLSGIGETATPSKTCRKREVAILPTCKHMFCIDCITEWSKQTNTCPIDRIKFNLIELWNLRTKARVSEIRVEDVLDSSLLAIGTDDLTYCEICGRCDREDVLLLCDGCNKGYHIDCLRPQLDFIPMDVWFCLDCAPNGRAFRWRVNPRSRIRQPSRENVVYENPHLPQFTELTQAASDNSSGTEDPTRIRRRRKRFIAPSSPSNSSDGDSEGETRSLSVSIRRPTLRPPAKKPRKKRQRRRFSNRSEDLSDVSFSSGIHTTRRTKRLCRKTSMRKRYQVVARPIRRSKLKARENTRKLFRNNSFVTSPSSSANTDLIHSVHPLTTQAVYTSSDQTDGEASDTSAQKILSSEKSCAVPDTDPLLSETDNVTSDSEGTNPDRDLVPGTDPMMSEHTVGATSSESDTTANGDIISDREYNLRDKKGLNGTSNDLSYQPCSSHSDNSNPRKMKHSSRSLRPRPRPAGKKVYAFLPRAEEGIRNRAPRLAKVQAEQILLLQEFFESDDVSD